jgi:hypothetical protein
MEIKWIEMRYSVLFSWALFIAIPLVVIGSFFLFSTTDEKKEAAAAIDSAQSVLSKARRNHLNLRDPGDAQNLKLAEEKLGEAKNLMIENEYQTAKFAADESARFSNRIAMRQGANQPPLAGAIRFDEMIGRVMVKPSGSHDYIQATKTMILSEGDRIQTGSHASCRIQFPDGLITVVRPNSQVSLKSTPGTGSQRGFTNLRLDTGYLTLKAPPGQEGRPTVSSQAGQAEAYQRSEVAMSYSAIEVSSEVSVYQGKALAKAGDFSKEVLKNQVVTMREDSVLGELIDLPPAPRLNTPDNYRKLEIGLENEVPVTFGWEAIPDIASYYIEISPNILFTEYIYDNPSIFNNQVEITNLKEGVYFWRVSCIDTDQRTGPPSPVWQFQIGQALISEMETVDNTPPKLKVNSISVHGYIVIISGKAEKGSEVYVNGNRAIQDILTGEFNLTLNMPSVGIHSIAIVAQDRAGNQTRDERQVLIEN